MRLKPQEEDVSGLKDDYDSIALMQEDGCDDLCDLNIPPGEVNGADIPLQEEEEDDILSCKFAVGDISTAMANSAKSRYNNREVSKKDSMTNAFIDCLIHSQVYDMSELLRIWYSHCSDMITHKDFKQSLYTNNIIHWYQTVIVVIWYHTLTSNSHCSDMKTHIDSKQSLYTNNITHWYQTVIVVIWYHTLTSNSHCNDMKAHIDLKQSLYTNHILHW